MYRREIESAVALAANADTTHEDASEWYGSYGWHLSTDEAGDVFLQAVEYDWLDDRTGDEAAEKLAAEMPSLSGDEVNSLVEQAQAVRDCAESICGLLDEAVTAYEAGDVQACRKALLSAYSQESDHGDSPAAQSLAGELLSEVTSSEDADN